MAGLPALDAILSTTSLAALKFINTAAFALNVGAVSVPGRLDGQQDDEMRKGEINPSKPNANETASGVYGRNRCRTLVDPSGWAFAIWGPIYLGETAFIATQLLSSHADAVIPGMTAPFPLVRIFRPSYLGDGMKKYISAGMLAGTAYSLSLVLEAGNAAAAANPAFHAWMLTPFRSYLVNLNGSLASDSTSSPRAMTALGHSSALAATALGVGVTVAMSAPVYGMTLAWALAACADGMKKRKAAHSEHDEKILGAAANVQRKLCLAGSFACLSTALYTALL
ncbi:hypothetical protein QTG54_002978 [Skeletonema marinoi]|uniref:Uncharacterized protein n=1 Tax=Skeletonema marinoi TaxID=267567 RepID=A0AAD8YJM8_9STRA|nr:hypothetical protein QTG54_002978 [Skeletonema marinoi]